MRVKPLILAILLSGVGASGSSLAAVPNMCEVGVYPTIKSEPGTTWNGFELQTRKDNPDSSAPAMEFRVGTTCFATRSGSRFSFEYRTEKTGLGSRHYSVEFTPELRSVGDVAVKVELFMAETQPLKSALISSNTHYLEQGALGELILDITGAEVFEQMVETKRKIIFSATPIRNAD